MIGEFYELKDLKVGMSVEIHRLEKIKDYPIFISLSSIERKKDLPYGRGIIVGVGKMPDVVPQGGLLCGMSYLTQQILRCMKGNNEEVFNCLFRFVSSHVAVLLNAAGW